MNHLAGDCWLRVAEAASRREAHRPGTSLGTPKILKASAVPSGRGRYLHFHASPGHCSAIQERLHNSKIFECKPSDSVLTSQQWTPLTDTIAVITAVQMMTLCKLKKTHYRESTC